MNPVDYKGLLLTRRANLINQNAEYRRRVAVLEADLADAKANMAFSAGGIEATNLALADLENPSPATPKAPSPAPQVGR